MKAWEIETEQMDGWREGSGGVSGWGRDSTAVTSELCETVHMCRNCMHGALVMEALTLNFKRTSRLHQEKQKHHQCRWRNPGMKIWKKKREMMAKLQNRNDVQSQGKNYRNTRSMPHKNKKDKK